ncbi:MAG: murein biosynthesis integral membrane protein MurJ [Alphaproteobacteria bacterium]|nr:murein biosynthesis integral membrane protein MurJ [Alphaproteobacteria bacterium]
MSLVKSSATIGFFTLLSRITGFVRDVIMANLIGASWLSDAFFVAFKLPNFFRRLFAEGAFNVAFIPSFASILTSEGRNEAMKFASEVLSILLMALLLLNAVFIIFMPWITPLFAPGFTDTPEKFNLTVTLSQITFPYILFISLVSLLGGVLNSFNKFAAPAANPILLNLCMIAGMLFLTHYTETPAHALAISVFVAGIVQLGWLIAICRNHAMLPSLLVPRITPKVKTMLLLMAPAALGSGVQQLNLLIDVIIASHIPDAVSYLYYADRITELPIGMIGVAIGTAMLPMMSKQIREGNKSAAQNSMNRGIELVMLFGFPATAALLALAEPIIRVLYFHGAFNAQDLVATYMALMAFTVGLPAFLLVKVFAPGFFANHDTKTPFKIAVLCVVINLILNLTLSIWLAHVGMALATSIAGWVNAGLMGYILHKRGIFVPDLTLKKRLIRMAVSAKIMVLAVIICNSLLAAFYHEGIVIRTATLGVVVTLGMVLYVFTAWYANALDKEQIGRLFRRNKS